MLDTVVQSAVSARIEVSNSQWCNALQLKIEPGDVLDELFGESLRNVGVRRVVELMRTYRGCPIYITVIKVADSLMGCTQTT